MPEMGANVARQMTDVEQKALDLIYKAAIPVDQWERRIREGYPKGVPYKTTATNYDKALRLLRNAGAGGNPNPAPGPSPSAWPTVPSKTRGKNGLYFYNLNDIAQAIEFAHDHNLWIAILVNETNLTPWQDGRRPEEAIFAERDRIKAAGVTCVASGWAEPFGDLDAQAEFIGHMSQGFDEYMLNIEAAWVYDAGVEAFMRSDIFAPKLRHAIGPNMPLSINADWGNNVHWRPWLEAGASAFRYQCYMNEWPHKNPKEAIELLGRAQADLPGGIPMNMREVTYGKYSSHNQPLETWTPQDDAAGKPPRSCWASEFVGGSDATWLAR
jgi:hypothetical protein